MAAWRAAGSPITLTSFVGRQREVEELRRLLASNRLVTLTGAGGSGKTRLAGELATSLGAEFPDGIFWVPLAPITDPEHSGHLQAARELFETNLVHCRRSAFGRCRPAPRPCWPRCWAMLATSRPRVRRCSPRSRPRCT